MPNEITVASEMKMMTLTQTKTWYSEFVQFTKDILKKDLDYGEIPGTKKPSLLKPGAEKLRLVYGLQTEMNCIDHVIDKESNFIDYTYKCIVRTKNGLPLAECEGSCNSYETKYRYRWIYTDKKPSKQDAEMMKAQGIGKWSKSDGQWVWLERVENENPFDSKNTIMKMAQKRAFVGAVLMATGASEFFTQDIEDLEHVIDVESGDSQPQKQDFKLKQPRIDQPYITDNETQLVCLVFGKDPEEYKKRLQDLKPMKFAKCWLTKEQAKKCGFGKGWNATHDKQGYMIAYKAPNIDALAMLFEIDGYKISKQAKIDLAKTPGNLPDVDEAAADVEFFLKEKSKESDSDQDTDTQPEQSDDSDDINQNKVK